MQCGEWLFAAKLAIYGTPLVVNWRYRLCTSASSDHLGPLTVSTCPGLHISVFISLSALLAQCSMWNECRKCVDFSTSYVRFYERDFNENARDISSEKERDFRRTFHETSTSLRHFHGKLQRVGNVFMTSFTCARVCWFAFAGFLYNFIHNSWLEVRA